VSITPIDPTTRPNGSRTCQPSRPATASLAPRVGSSSYGSPVPGSSRPCCRRSGLRPAYRPVRRWC
jgi:hypothetical protein